MDNLKQASISKNRSYTACLSEAHKMLFDNIRCVFGRTWIYATIVALLCAAYSSLHITYMLYGGGTVIVAATITAAIATICAQIAYVAKVMQLVNGRHIMWNIARCIKLALCGVCVSAVLAFIFAALVYIKLAEKGSATLHELLPLFVIFAIVTLVAGLLMLPWVYVAMKYVMQPECRLHNMALKAYMIGLHYWGFIFIGLLLATLCVVVCAALISLPLMIISAANTLSVLGVNYLGDPTGLPQYFGFIQFMVIALSTFIYQYIHIFIIFVCYFLYGSIETREKEKLEYRKNENLSA